MVISDFVEHFKWCMQVLGTEKDTLSVSVFCNIKELQKLRENVP